ncbi:peptidylprolyl isomerase [Fimbriiglobus ruber]|uniref:Peptidyl-prolyl cis-trans isomerase PpiD n=1 Tax=Fimbriiglobus ruber TaxID=1908690 RepID=A0A225DIM2_9BACT|nr:peptidylprolyl isomerase [Fimbriiglobus ruber]OWK35967.1 Peptidyl-prolyl cis-trans isomerase PpiD [Fimbriiglobus ruber]
MPHVLSCWFRAAVTISLAAIAPLPIAHAKLAPPARPSPPAPATDVAATVNGEVIRRDQVDAAMKPLGASAVPQSATQARMLRLEVLNDLIDDLLLRQFLRQYGSKVESREVDKHVRALTESLRRQGKSLADYCRETSQTEVSVRDSLTAQIQFARYVAEKSPEAELRKFYEANRDFFDKVTVKAHQIVLRVSQATPPEERAAARQKLAEVRAEILAGKQTFADAARKYSMDATALDGGAIGSITRRDAIVDEPIARAAFALKVGEVSEPTETDYGIHLVQITERKPGPATTYEGVAGAVREFYADEFRQNLTKDLRKRGKIQIVYP